MNDKVSVIIPVFNAGEKLRRCLDAIIKQTYGNIEIITVDDGSSDDSLLICQEYAKTDKRILPVHTENQGSGPARNAGIRKATGRWGYFPDADDVIKPDTIEKAMKAAEENDCDLVVFGFEELTESGKRIRIKRYPRTMMDGEDVRRNYEKHYIMDEPLWIQGAPWNKFFDLNVVREHGIEYPPLRRHQDEGFICRYVEHVNRVCFIEDVLYTYYANDAAAVNRKYPVDYVDCVMGLYNIRKDTILKWNPRNVTVRDVVYEELLCNTIWAFELSFNKKYGFNKRERLSWMAEKCNGIDFSEISWGRLNKHPYHRMVARLLPDHINMAYAVIKAKALLQRLIKK